MKVGIVVGTRPEIIKMSPIIRHCEALKAEGLQDIDYSIIHTGQHYTYEMDKVFFDELELPQPHHCLDVGSGTHGETTARIVERMEKVLQQEKPDVILVEGDTNSVLGGALAAAKLDGIKVGHVEAGLRSYDRSMPEEINRKLTDHASDYLFPPTELAKQILLGEGIDDSKIIVVGNTIVDAVYQNLELAEKRFDMPNKLGLPEGKYVLVTAHRQENVDNEKKLRNIITGLKMVGGRTGMPIVYPIHPRTEKMLQRFGIPVPEEITLMSPMGFLEFLQLEAHAGLIITDSGGIQEEACILNVPCVTIRENTERPETVHAGANILAGTDPERILGCAQMMLKSRKDWVNPLGDGTSAKKIISHIMEHANLG